MGIATRDVVLKCVIVLNSVEKALSWDFDLFNDFVKSQVCMIELGVKDEEASDCKLT